MPMKAIISITEHLITLLLIIIVIIGMIILLTSYQAGRLSLEQQKTLSGHALQAITFLISDPLLTAEHSVFDGTKLAAAKMNEQAICSQVEKRVGFPWFLVIEGTTGSGDCGSAYRITCSRWSLCERNARNTSYLLPVNVQRLFDPAFPVTGRMDFALLRAGVYQ